MALAASGFYLYSNKYLDPNDFGAVRVGRAIATVGFFFLIWGWRGTTDYIQVFIHGADGHASHVYVEIHIYPYMCKAPTTQLHRHGCLPSRADQYSCMHNRCRLIVGEWDCTGSLLYFFF